MTGDDFAQLLNEFTHSAESGDGARFASHFTEDAIYYDYIYGPHKGRADIAHMMQELSIAMRRISLGNVRSRVRRRTGYAWSLSSFTSKIPQFKGRPS